MIPGHNLAQSINVLLPCPQLNIAIYPACSVPLKHTTRMKQDICSAWVIRPCKTIQTCQERHPLFPRQELPQCPLSYPHSPQTEFSSCFPDEYLRLQV